MAWRDCGESSLVVILARLQKDRGEGQKQAGTLTEEEAWLGLGQWLVETSAVEKTEGVFFIKSNHSKECKYTSVM